MHQDKAVPVASLSFFRPEPVKSIFSNMDSVDIEFEIAG